MQMKNNIPNKSITLQQMKEMFNNMKKNWDVTQPMLWGFYFTHHDQKLLEKTKEILIEKGYDYVDLYLSDKENKNDPDMYWLHMEKVEIHTPESLDKRNDEFYFLANDLGIDSYDGMDVGPIMK